jgi:hypothetical protein
MLLRFVLKKKKLGGMSMPISQVPKAKGAWFSGSLRGCGVSQKVSFHYSLQISI